MLKPLPGIVHAPPRDRRCLREAAALIQRQVASLRATLKDADVLLLRLLDGVVMPADLQQDSETPGDSGAAPNHLGASLTSGVDGGGGGGGLGATTVTNSTSRAVAAGAGAATGAGAAAPLQRRDLRQLERLALAQAEVVPAAAAKAAAAAAAPGAGARWVAPAIHGCFAPGTRLSDGVPPFDVTLAARRPQTNLSTVQFCRQGHAGQGSRRHRQAWLAANRRRHQSSQVRG